jgi:hypothetical protein
MHLRSPPQHKGDTGMAFEGWDKATIEVCEDCVMVIEYGCEDRGISGQDLPATAEALAQAWPDCVLVNGCGRDCPDHGIAAYESEEQYEEAKEYRDTPTWLSHSECDGCGYPYGGTREHATVYIPPKTGEGK